MATFGDLSPAERAPEIAYRREVAPVETSWHQQASVSAANKHAEAADAMAKAARADVEAMDRRLAENNHREDVRAVMAAAAAIAVDVTSSLDMALTLEQRDKKSVERALAMWAQCNQAMKKP